MTESAAKRSGRVSPVINMCDRGVAIDQCLCGEHVLPSTASMLPWVNIREDLCSSGGLSSLSMSCCFAIDEWQCGVGCMKIVASTSQWQRR